MMKWKKQKIFMLVLSLSLIAACSSADKNQIKRNGVRDQKTNIQNTKDNESAKILSSDKSLPIDKPIQETKSNVKTFEKTGEENGTNNRRTYKIESTSYNEKEVNISFPSIVGLGDTVKQSKVNDILKHEALVVFNDFYGGVVNNLSLKINYKITWASKNLLSVQYYGYAFNKGAAYPLDLLYTVNIDMNKICKLMLKDFIKIDKDFINKYRSYKVVDLDKNQMEAGAFKYILDTYAADDLLRYFSSADTSYKESAFTFSYFKEDTLGISIEVPHVVGDHLEIELKYKDIKENLRTENEIWKDFTNLSSQK